MRNLDGRAGTRFHFTLRADAAGGSRLRLGSAQSSVLCPWYGILSAKALADLHGATIERLGTKSPRATAGSDPEQSVKPSESRHPKGVKRTFTDRVVRRRRSALQCALQYISQTMAFTVRVSRAPVPSEPVKSRCTPGVGRSALRSGRSQQRANLLRGIVR